MSENQYSLEAFNQMSKGTLNESLGVEFIEVSKTKIKATMPVDERTIQPYGILHGGASVALAETIGSIGATLNVDASKQHCVGLEINANHIKSVYKGSRVYATGQPLHIGGKTQIWEIKITNEEDKLVCVSRITLAVLDKK